MSCLVLSFFPNSTSGFNPFPLLVLITLILTLQWFRDILREASLEGSHSKSTQLGFKWGIILFISSECTLFLSFFWGYFHFSLSALLPLGLSWPPAGLTPCHTFDLPLLNTVLLVSRGLTVTACHHYFTSSNFSSANFSLNLTIFLGVYFLFTQGLEFSSAPFTIIDGSFGSIFYLSSGAHGIHVFLGVILLSYSASRLSIGHISIDRHLSFEFAAWYWHFVDVVWLFLFRLYYWWGAYRVFTAVPSRVPPVILKFMGNFGSIPTSLNPLGYSQTSVWLEPWTLRP